MSVFNEPTAITAEQAISVLPDGDDIHTFRNLGAGMMLGADWRRDGIIEVLTKAEQIQLTGATARGMGHGMVIDDDGLLFIETDEAKLAALESEIMEVA